MDTLNRPQLYKFFDEKISKTAMVERDGEWFVKGRWSLISVWGDGEIDIWLCDPSELPNINSLGTGKINNMCTVLADSAKNLRVKWTVRKLTGEACTQGRGKGVVLQNLKLLGIRKKREGGFIPTEHQFK